MGEILKFYLPPVSLPEAHMILGKNTPEGRELVNYAANPLAICTVLQSARLFCRKMDSMIGSIAMTTVTNGLTQAGLFSQNENFFFLFDAVPN